jgi:hypothetical protein
MMQLWEKSTPKYSWLSCVSTERESKVMLTTYSGITGVHTFDLLLGHRLVGLHHLTSGDLHQSSLGNIGGTPLLGRLGCATGLDQATGTGIQVGVSSDTWLDKSVS